MTDAPDRDWAAAAHRLGVDAVHDDRPTRWVDELWSAVERDELDLPWNRTDPFPVIADAVAAMDPGDGRRAVVVGAALGADAEALARAGWATTAFDVSPAAVRLVQERYPASVVDYRVGDLLDLSSDLVGAFDLVVEVFTVQAMPPAARSAAQRGVRRLLAPDAEALVIQFVRGDADPLVGPPWLLDRDEMEAFGSTDVVLESLTSVTRDGAGDVWFARLRRSP